MILAEKTKRNLKQCTKAKEHQKWSLHLICTPKVRHFWRSISVGKVYFSVDLFQVEICNEINTEIEDAFDEFEMFNIYEALPQIIELWGENKATTSNSKKK